MQRVALGRAPRHTSGVDVAQMSHRPYVPSAPPSRFSSSPHEPGSYLCHHPVIWSPADPSPRPDRRRDERPPGLRRRVGGVGARCAGRAGSRGAGGLRSGHAHRAHAHAGKCWCAGRSAGRRRAGHRRCPGPGTCPGPSTGPDASTRAGRPRPAVPCRRRPPRWRMTKPSEVAVGPATASPAPDVEPEPPRPRC